MQGELINSFKSANCYYDSKTYIVNHCPKAIILEEEYHYTDNELNSIDVCTKLYNFKELAESCEERNRVMLGKPR